MTAAIETATCRACGGVAAVPHANRFGFCQHCWRAVCIYSGADINVREMTYTDEGVSDENVTRWLAFTLARNLEAFQRHGVAGRCEAIVGADWQSSVRHQCSGAATKERDGRRVCRAHARSMHVLYVGPERDPYHVIEFALLAVMAGDDKVRNIVRRLAVPATQCATTPTQQG